MNNKLEKYPSSNELHVKKNEMNMMVHQNKLTSKFIDYLEKMDMSNLSGIAYARATNLIVVNKDYNNNQVIHLSF